MDLAMQIISIDKAVRSDTIEDLKEFNHNLYQVKPKSENN